MPPATNYPTAPFHTRERTALLLAASYLLLVTAFILLTLFAPTLMTNTSIPLPADWTLSLAGANLAIASGLSLILAPIFLTLLYHRLTK